MNKVILIGNLTRDPELRTTQSGTTLCSFGLAVNRRRKSEGQPEVDFFTVTVWQQLGEVCAKYLRKGRKCCVVGRLQTRQYEKDGVKHTVTDIIAEDVEFLSSARDAGQENSGAAAPAKTPAGDYDVSGFAQADEEELPF